MKILVGIKRVVDYNVRIRVKSDGSDVDTDGVKMSINPFDEIALEEAKQMQLTLPGLALARQVYQQVIEAGGAKRGTHALIQALAHMSDIQWSGPKTD